MATAGVRVQPPLGSRSRKRIPLDHVGLSGTHFRDEVSVEGLRGGSWGDALPKRRAWLRESLGLLGLKVRGDPRPTPSPNSSALAPN